MLRQSLKRFAIAFLALGAILPQMHAQYTLVGDAQDMGDGCFLMTDTVNTPGGSPNWKSAVWNNVQIDLNNPVDLRIQVSMSAQDSSLLGDGMAIVLQGDGLGAISTSGGGAIGYAQEDITPGPPCPSAGPFVGGITPSLGVELDTWDNTVQCHFDSPQDQIACLIDGMFESPLFTFSAIATMQNIGASGNNNYKCYEFRITYSGAADTTLRIYFNGALKKTQAINLVDDVFGGNNLVWWGWTASTGMVNGHIVVCHEFANAGADTTVCEGNTVPLTGSGDSLNIWAPMSAALACDTCDLNTFTPPDTGLYGFQLTAVNYMGCRDRDSVFVTVVNAPVVDAGPNPPVICAGGSAILNGDTTGSGPGMVLLWSPPAGLSSTSSLSPTASPSITTLYTLTVTDTVTGCVASDDVLVTVGAPDSVTIVTPDSTICIGDTVAIVVNATSGMTSFSWAPPAGLSDPTISNPVATPSVTTTYVLTATNTALGCSDIENITISVSDVTISPLVDDSICLGDTLCISGLVISGGVGSTYLADWTWSGPDAIIGDSTETPCVVATQTGTFEVVVTDLASGCADSASMNLTVSQSNLTVDPATETINPGQVVQLSASGAQPGSTYTWNPDTAISCTVCPNPMVNPSQTTTYTVSSVDLNGCIATGMAVIEVDSFQIPNVFSPNGDGVNDVLYLNYYGPGKQYLINIYDRWGKEVFTTTDPAVNWDGKNKGGNDVPEGVYFLVINIIADQAIEMESKQLAVSVTLLR